MVCLVKCAGPSNPQTSGRVRVQIGGSVADDPDVIEHAYAHGRPKLLADSEIM